MPLASRRRGLRPVHRSVGSRARWVTALGLLCACGPAGPAARPSLSPSAPASAPAANQSDLIRVHVPALDGLARSPLRVTGEARGTWYFEATFPVALLDARGNELARSYAQAHGEWMTESFVPFEAELRFAPPATSTGTLVLEKANASGLPEHADELRLPVRFAADSP